ncbi:hypothetical protein A3J61_00405 [Candidatus Nomurabacteria bacterium RIFCSPHIGHO2_02_FULL_38_15]|uniref:Bro-N domain-containing protein n=1 Tax=Candidatus Nomurabacteria bacterium RIFCSPHIGHO2_02_FULL_38_15 TaxID=1801752 RepID=A0A1F6VRZ3_9BACT|nr:MAG: hypothetical protein A3J61_00405 [Candidatus Nomurabacteria bacterium RIFCSPHIGHO2_02_FULL_38_15]
MTKKTKNRIAIFENKEIRRHWDDEKEEWYFSVVDIIFALTGSINPQVYWRVLKKRLIDEGSNETVTKCNELKMIVIDGKIRITDVADTKTVLRLVQSIPSPKAEPFKLWLARVGYERLEETADPEIGIHRALKTKNLKGLKKESLRDNMTNLELVLNMLAETATNEIHKKENSKGMVKLKSDAKAGGSVAGGARKKLEKRLKHPIVSKSNFLKNKENVKSLKGKK